MLLLAWHASSCLKLLVYEALSYKLPVYEALSYKLPVYDALSYYTGVVVHLRCIYCSRRRL